jgi:NADH dehydrogenase (ubiquinone) Fe-S protein 4
MLRTVARGATGSLKRTVQVRFISKEAADVVKRQEQHGELPKELVSGAPLELITDRVVRIYQESKPATQSGTWGQHNWKIDWDVLGKGNRWENDLIGYQSSGDYM